MAYSLSPMKLNPLLLANKGQCLPAMTKEAIDKVRMIEEIVLGFNDPIEFPTEHLIHGGMYSRTLHMKAGELMTGALIKVGTILIVSGDCTVFIGEEAIELRDYSVLPGSAGRKQVFLAHTDLSMTMLFPTNAKTVEQAEKEFTDEYAMLMTNRMDCVTTLITGE